MRARQVFMDSLKAHGVERIFGNPGTTESPLLDSLIDHPEIRYVTTLQESVALCAASYYAQASGKSGVVSLHVAPGLGNALGMLYCAMRANSPLVVTAGQQDTRLRLADPVLGHDLVAMAAPLTKWSVQVERADEMGPILARAFKVAQDGPPGPVFVGLPIDVMEQETDIAATTAGPVHAKPAAARAALQAIAELLVSARAPVIVAGDNVARAGGTEALATLARRLGAAVWGEMLHTHVTLATSDPHFRGALPLDAHSIRKMLGDADVVLLLGGPFFEDVWFAPGGPFPKGSKIVQIEETASRLAYNHALAAGAVGDLAEALKTLVVDVERRGGPALAAEVDKRNSALAAMKAREAAAQKERVEKAWARHPISMPRVMAEVRDAMPADAIVVEESITAAIDFARTFEFSGPGTYFGARGGGIGQGLSGALGVAIGKPGQPVLCISGDGSAMYSIQALWTAAHLELPIVFVILANREYRVLKHNIDVYRQRFAIASQAPYAHMDLATPSLGFVEMAAGMGVAATRIADPAAIGPVLRAAFAAKRPYLVEIAIEGKR
jgi:benzoylformate decarboxylase